MKVRYIDDLVQEFNLKLREVSQSYGGAILLGFINEGNEGYTLSYIIAKSNRYIDLLSEKSKKLIFSKKIPKNEKNNY